MMISMLQNLPILAKHRPTQGDFPSDQVEIVPSGVAALHSTTLAHALLNTQDRRAWGAHLATSLRCFRDCPVTHRVVQRPPEWQSTQRTL
mmetsp:Transcript_51118/g.103984  ORF Transcript_51118/g.103984 Transcript_51118/m.103984 type:complete len:90 (+) Transcript_51118:197-466(+)